MTRSKAEAMDEQPPQNHCLSLAQKRRAANFQAAATAGYFLGIADEGYLGFAVWALQPRLSTYVDAYNQGTRTAIM